MTPFSGFVLVAVLLLVVVLAIVVRPLWRTVADVAPTAADRRVSSSDALARLAFRVLLETLSGDPPEAARKLLPSLRIGETA